MQDDRVEFGGTGMKHNVFQVYDADAFDGCDLSSDVLDAATEWFNPAAAVMNVTIPLTTPGNYLFVCAVAGHCNQQRVNVTVPAEAGCAFDADAVNDRGPFGKIICATDGDDTTTEEGGGDDFGMGAGVVLGNTTFPNNTNGTTNDDGGEGEGGAGSSAASLASGIVAVSAVAAVFF